MDLIDAIIENNMEIVRELLKNGADPNLYLDAAKVRPLHFAAQDNRVAIGRLLIENGANINVNTYPEGLSPLDVAKLHDNIEFIALLEEFLSK